MSQRAPGPIFGGQDISERTSAVTRVRCDPQKPPAGRTKKPKSPLGTKTGRQQPHFKELTNHSTTTGSEGDGQIT